MFESNACHQRQFSRFAVPAIRIHSQPTRNSTNLAHGYQREISNSFWWLEPMTGHVRMMSRGVVAWQHGHE